MGFFEKLQAKLELYRLEQRYTRRDKRTTFISDAQYVDGEYVYSPSSPKSIFSASSGGSGQFPYHQRRWAPRSATNVHVQEIAREGVRV